jgi:hypothetical protein
MPNTITSKNDLFALFEEVFQDWTEGTSALTEMSDKARKKEAEKFLLSLPKFTPTEAWGNPESTGRKTINRIFSVIGGGASVEGKLAYLQRITDVNNRITSPRRVIASLIMLEALAAIISDFNEASAGFVFEGWLSALLQGRQEAERTDKGNLPIQDLVAFTQLKEGTPTVPVSLKLLSPKTKVEGSYTNLVDALFDEPEFGGRMYYVVARKLENHIVVEGFDINRGNFIDLMTLQGGAKGTTKLKGSGAVLFEVSDTAILRKHGLRRGDAQSVIDLLKSLDGKPDEQYEILMRTAGYTQLSRKLAQIEKEKDQEQGQEDQNFEDPEIQRLAKKFNLKKDPQSEKEENLLRAQEKAGVSRPRKSSGSYRSSNSLREAAIKRYSDRERLLTESSQTQWTLSVSQIDVLVKHGVIELATLGELPKTRDMVIEVATMHMDTVRDKFMILFKAFADLNDNINKYITFPKRNEAIKAGERAISDTGVIQKEIQDNVQADEVAAEEDLD